MEEYRDSSLPVRQRVEDLLARMTLEEKLAQLCSDLAAALMPGMQGDLAGHLAEKYPSGLGRFTQYSTLGITSPVAIATLSNALQRYFCEQTRLGIPVMLQSENLSGYPGMGGTLFPAMINAGATFEPELVESAAAAIGAETGAVGIRQALSPVLDLARDPRWGRMYEAFGEDPYLVAQMGTGYVRGMQGEGVLATAKHFLGYSETQAGLNTAATRLGERELYEHFATPFEAATKQAGLAAVMASYSEIDGQPCGANPQVIRKLLREKVGFDGLLVSDGGAVWKLFDTYHVAASYEEAGLLAVQAGLETEMPVGDSFRQLAQYVEQGALEVGVIDDAVRHVLETKFRAGLFENPYVDVAAVEKALAQPQAVALSRKMALESVTLLKNEGTLPLAPGGRLAVIGPHAVAQRPLISGYTLPAYFEMLAGFFGGNAKEVTFHGMADEGRKAEAGAGEGADAAGEIAALLKGVDDMEAKLRELYGTRPLADELATAHEVLAVQGCEVMGTDTGGIAAAVAAARQADAVVLALGGNCGWTGTSGGEGKDRMGLGLPGVQQELLEAVAQTGRDIVLVLFGPGPYAPTLPENVKAVVMAWLPGVYGPEAVAKVLDGRHNPGGKLPATFPRNAGQVPIYHFHKPASGYNKAGETSGFGGEIFGGGYTDGDNRPWFPYGHGLSYTSFSIEDVACDGEAPVGGTIRLACTLRNTGDRAGSEVLQLYYRDVQAHVTRPVKQLCGFHKLWLEPGQAARVTFVLDTNSLGFVDENMDFVLEPGDTLLMLGTSSEEIAAVKNVRLTGAKQCLAGKRSYSCGVEEKRIGEKE